MDIGRWAFEARNARPGARPPRCSAETRRGGSPRTSPSCQVFCAPKSDKENGRQNSGGLNFGLTSRRHVQRSGTIPPSRRLLWRHRSRCRRGISQSPAGPRRNLPSWACGHGSREPILRTWSWQIAPQLKSSSCFLPPCGEKRPPIFRRPKLHLGNTRIPF